MLFCLSTTFSDFFQIFFVVRSGIRQIKRRRRDLNPRAAINDLHPFQGCPFSLLGTSPRLNKNLMQLLLRKALLFETERVGFEPNIGSESPLFYCFSNPFFLWLSSSYQISFSAVQFVILTRFFSFVKCFF